MRRAKAVAQMHEPSRSIPSTPRQNDLLAALPAAVYRRLLPCLELVALRLGPILFSAPGKMRYAYFPTTSVLTMTYTIGKGVSAKAWQVGHEGVAGLSSLSDSTRKEQAEVQTAGHAFRLPATALRTEFSRGGAFQQLLLCYLNAMIAQVSQLGICNQYHTLEKRLCRHLLRAFDRVPASEANKLAITHQGTADLLGVRRVGVTEAAGRLHAAGIIHCGRGHITLLDRRKLEAQACECYATMKKEFHGLLQGKSASR